jgi:hypothetical protein
LPDVQIFCKFAIKLGTMKTTRNQSTSKQKKTAESVEAVSKKGVTISKPDPTEDEIRTKAREIYHDRMVRGEHGTSEGDWIKAEELLKASKK